jgi:hypothetical protein
MKANVKPVTKREVGDEEEETQDRLNGLEIKPLTQDLIDRLLLDRPLEPAIIVDFGVESAAHYRALKAALSNDDTDVVNDDEAEGYAEEHRQRTALRTRIVELDAACGNATKLNAFIQRHAPEYAEIVYFTPTSWDYIEGRA